MEPKYLGGGLANIWGVPPGPNVEPPLVNRSPVERFVTWLNLNRQSLWCDLLSEVWESLQNGKVNENSFQVLKFAKNREFFKFVKFAFLTMFVFTQWRIICPNCLAVEYVCQFKHVYLPRLSFVFSSACVCVASYALILQQQTPSVRCIKIFQRCSFREFYAPHSYCASRRDVVGWLICHVRELWRKRSIITTEH